MGPFDICATCGKDRIAHGEARTGHAFVLGEARNRPVMVEMRQDALLEDIHCTHTYILDVVAEYWAHREERSQDDADSVLQSIERLLRGYDPSTR